MFKYLSHKSILIKSTQLYFRKLSMTSVSKMNLHGVISILENFAPVKHALEWDNVGLLIEPSTPQIITSILLTNDLTLDVIDEAVVNKTNLILSYHPPIFSGIKCISQSNVRGEILSKCLENKIAVYSPHTTYDVMKNGVNDWLIRPLMQYSSNLQPIKSNFNFRESDTYVGEGRILHLNFKLTISKIVEIMKKHLKLEMLRVAMGRGKNLETSISSIACCAGAGSSILANVMVDMFLTGEMSHHSILDATEKGITILLTEHSNSERGFLTDILRSKLIELLGKENITIDVSKADKDPIVIL